jgi:hypothetical protein
MGPHGRRTEAKAVPCGWAGKDEGSAFQEGRKDGLEIGARITAIPLARSWLG